MTERDGGPAFPVDRDGFGQDGPYKIAAAPGMSMRDYFAAQALSQLLHIRGYGGDADSKRRIAAEAYDFADAMLVERAKL